MRTIKKVLFSPVLMLFLLVILGTALGTATFIENDFGAEVAKLKVYNTKWLELVFILLSVNLIGRIFILKLYKSQKFSIFLFHLAFVVMVLGAAVTRYFGYEGSMHIREGQASSQLITANKVLAFTVEDETINVKADLEHKHSFNHNFKTETGNYNVNLIKYYPNAYPKAIEDENGDQIIGFVIAGSTFRGFDYLNNQQEKIYDEISIGFNTTQSAVNITTENDSLILQSSLPVIVGDMGGLKDTLALNQPIKLEYKKLYKVGTINFVLQEYLPKAKITAVPTEMQGHKLAAGAMVFKITEGINSTEIIQWENEANRKSTAMLNGKTIGLAYGNKIIDLPFNIYLDDFVIERYPGSMSPSSFSSYVKLNEEGKEPVPFHIYMNNILKHHGYRFYQSSYDQDERGTILSVNHDWWGTFITYLGYFIMTLGILWSMLNNNSFFRKTVVRGVKTLVIFAIVTFAGTQTSNAQNNVLPADFVSIDKQHAEDFGKLLIQNNKGRTEPIYTYASELMRKIARKEKMYGLNSVQIFMEMNMHPDQWIDIPVIQVSNKELQTHLGLTSKYAAYTDFISQEKGYILQQMVQMVYAKSPAERSKFDKAVIKTDEKVNICYAIFSGRYMKILPVPGDSDTKHWFPAQEASLRAQNTEDSLFLSNILPAYFDEVTKAKTTGNYNAANEFLDGMKRFQKKNAGYELPSDFRTNVEIAYYKFNPFSKLFMFYATIGVLFLFILIGIIVAGKTVPKWTNRTFFTIVLIAFIVHTLGVAARWVSSGHAPMSNGYESMIFISWVTLLAGFLFSKRTPFAIPATATLGGLTLMVANLSFMDPEITNLVPVLQSYWLTIHVSVITASYGFLGLGALLGIINLILIIFRTQNNHKRIIDTLESLTVLNHKTLIAGLYLLTIGTFLGAVWANESWGRYWGWDPKETWALISILVYTIVTHARLIPGLKGVFTFNVLALFGFSSILMTYFGVNYYLSGLHSYAAGDPVPIPTFVYYTIAIVVILTLGASVKYSKLAAAEGSSKE